MPTNKRESLIFTVIMCFCMVFGMSVYNVLRVHGWHFDVGVIAEAWVGFPPAYVVACFWTCWWRAALPSGLHSGFW